jgi:hypothetical protein
MRLFLLSVFSFLLISCGGSSSAPSDPKAANTPSSESATTPRTTVQPTSPQPTPTIQVPPDNRLRIAKIGVYAPLTKRTVPRNSTVPEGDDAQKLGDPDGPDDVVLYDWTGWQAFGGTVGQGNALLYGRPDSGRVPCKNGTIPPPCQAVFWDLTRLAIGDEIQLFVDQKPYVYKVASRCEIPTDDFKKADWIYLTSKVPVATLFTHGGDFDREKGAYTRIRVIRAESEEGTLPRACPPGSTPLPGGSASVPASTPSAGVLTMTYVGQEPSGSVGNAPANLVPQRFKVTGLPANTPIPELGPNIHVSPKLPPRNDNLPWDVAAIRFDKGDLVIFVPPSSAAGSYDIRIELPDGRKAQSNFTYKP